MPDNPPAKLWELLRRNSRFQRTAKFLLSLESVRQGGDPKKWERTTDCADRVLTRVGQHNPCAETALRWLAFPPLFIRRVIACEPGREADLAAGKVVPIDTVGIGWGRHPHESPETPWIFFASQIPTASDGMDSAESRANARGRPACLGPEVETVTSGDPRLQSSCRDEIAEWTAYHAAGHRFTLDTPWPDTPVGFRRTFGAQWARLCGKGRVAETNFFCDWNLATLAARASKAVKAANRLAGDLIGDLDRVRRGESETVCPPVPTRGGNSFRSVPQVGFSLTETEQVKLFEFAELRRHRVFALPHLLTREDVEPVLAELKRQLLDELPASRDLLGTPRSWEVLLEIEARQGSHSANRSLAIADYLRANISASRFVAAGFAKADRDRWLRDGRLVTPPATATPAEMAAFERARRRFNQAYKAEQNSSRHIPRWVAHFDCLIQATFPRLDLHALLKATPS